MSQQRRRYYPPTEEQSGYGGQGTYTTDGGVGGGGVQQPGSFPQATYQPGGQGPTQPFVPQPGTVSPPPPMKEATPIGPPPTGYPATQTEAPTLRSSHRVYPLDPESLGYDQVGQLGTQMGALQLGGGQPNVPGLATPFAKTAPLPSSSQAFPSPLPTTPPSYGGPQGGIGGVGGAAYTTTNAPSSMEQPCQVPSPSTQCPPLYMRMTMGAVPNTQQLLTKSGIPLGCMVHPLVESSAKEDHIPVVNFGLSGIIRCRRCRAYINPFVSFIDGGRKWRCNLCTLANEVPGDYYSPLDSSGRRVDLSERAELQRGVVEFIAPSEYMVRPPQPPTYFFLIDAGYYSVTSGMFQTAIQAIKDTLDDFPGDTRTKIGFITFDSSIHFYNLKSSLSNPQMLVVHDLEDPFVPIADDLLVNLQESKEVVKNLLSKLPKMFASTQNTDNCLGAVLKVAFTISEKIGGKLMVFSNSLPNVGPGKLKSSREDPKLLGTDKESQLLLPEELYYKNFSLECSRVQLSVDLFLFSGQYTDVATLGTLSEFTGGQVYYYPAFKVDKDGEKFYRDLVRNVTRPTGFEAVMRVRTSKGLKIHAHFGNFFIRSADLLALPNVDSDKAFGVQFQLDENLTSKYISFQSALLYTTSSGERRIRVFTICLPVTNIVSDLFKYADLDCITAITAKMALDKGLQSSLSDAREALVNKCIDILTSYRTDVFAGSATQLVLPESLKVFPLYVLALAKNILLRAGSDIKSDERSFWIMSARTWPVHTLIHFIYPRLFTIFPISPEAGAPGPDGRVVLPPITNLSSEKLDRRAAYLLDDGQNLLMWIGRQAQPDFAPSLFGVSSLDTVDTSQLQLRREENEISIRVNNILNEVRAQRTTFQNLQIIREGEPREFKFFASFVEDRSKTSQSYYEFLVSLQQKVQAKVSKK